MKRGRKTKLTPELQERIHSFILASNYFETACWAAGITPRTGYAWLNLGENAITEIEDGKRAPSDHPHYAYYLFAMMVRQAEAQAEIADIAFIKAGRDGWQSRAWIRERRSKERWSRRDYQEVKVIGTLGLKAEDLSDDELAAIIKRSTAQGRGGSGVVEEKGGSPKPD
jgi:hypothetical protein